MDGPANETVADAPPEKRARLARDEEAGHGRRKRTVALFLSYIGEGYHGMQSNPGVRTIEDELEKALFQAGGISERDRGSFAAVRWNRAARTDKGVSAACQVVSLRLLVSDRPDTDRLLVDRINEHLPDDIRVHRIVRATGSFCARMNCDRRTYEYLLPLSVLVDAPVAGPGHIAESIGRLNDVLASYVGTHAFHNFAERMSPSDKARFRYIISCKSEGPFQSCGADFVKVTIVGQSFVLHQIRNMVGLALMVRSSVLSKCAATMLLTSEMRTSLLPS